MTTNIKCTNGNISAYGFSCGYIQRSGIVNDYHVEIYAEHGIYHVRFCDCNKVKVWNSYELLNSARNFFNQISNVLN